MALLRNRPGVRAQIRYYDVDDEDIIQDLLLATNIADE